MEQDPHHRLPANPANPVRCCLALRKRSLTIPVGHEPQTPDSTHRIREELFMGSSRNSGNTREEPYSTAHLTTEVTEHTEVERRRYALLARGVGCETVARKRAQGFTGSVLRDLSVLRGSNFPEFRDDPFFVGERAQDLN